MKKLVKWILFSIMGIVLLLIAGFFALKQFVDPNDYKDVITDMIYERTGHRINIPGDIVLHIAPNLDITLQLGAITVDSPPGFTTEQLLDSKEAELSVALMPLLSEKQLVVNRVSMQGITLALEVDQQGKSNWMTDKLAPSGDKKPAPAPQKDGESKGPAGIEIGGIDFRDINLQYTNAVDGTALKLSGFHLKTGRITADQPFSLDTGFQLEFEKPEQKASSALVKLTSLVSVQSAGKHITTRDTILSLQVKQKQAPVPMDIRLGFNGDLRPKEEKLVLDQLVLKLNDITMEGTLSLDTFSDPQLRGSLEVSSFSPKAALKNLDIQLPATTDPSVLGALSASLDFSASKTSFTTDNLSAKLDDTTLNASLEVRNFKQPNVIATAHLDIIDLDRYLPVKGAGSKKASKGKQTAKKDKKASKEKQTAKQTPDTGVIPVETLRKLKGKTKLNIDRFKAGKLTLTDMAAEVTANKGVITLRPFTAKLYNGTLDADAKINARGKLPQIRFRKALNNIELAPLLTDLQGKAELSGTANISLQGTTKGLERKQLTRNANGDMQLSLTNGIIKKLTILETIRQAKAIFDNEPLTSAAAEQPTGFAQLTATGKLTKGVFVNNDLLAESELMKVTGKGKLDLNTEMVDYLLTVYLTDRVERKEDSGLVALGNKPIPYRIRGSLSKLEQSAAIEELLKEELKGALFKELQKQLEPQSSGEEKDSTESEQEMTPETLLKQGLKGLFGN